MSCPWSRVVRLPVVLAVLLLIAAVVNAASSQSITLTDVPSTIDESQEFEVSVLVWCMNCTSDTYLRGVFYPSGTSYFGYTQDNGGNWTNASGSNCKEYYLVPQSDFSAEGSWSGRLKVRPDKENAYYTGPGEYLFKVGRYTPSCGSPSSSGGWSQESIIAITGPTPTPSPTNAPTNAPTYTPQPSPMSSPTSTRTPTPTIKPTRRLMPTGSTIFDILGTSAIASTDAQTSAEATIGGSALSPNRTHPFVFAFLFVGVGIGLLSFAIALQKVDLWKKLISQKNQNDHPGM